MTETKPATAGSNWIEAPGHHDAKRNIFQRMHQVMQAVDYIQREKKPGMQYPIVSHDKVTAKVRPEMVKAGIVYFPLHMQTVQNGNRTEIAMMVRFQNIDNPDDFMDVATAGYGVDPADKGVGKAISYAVKYALLKSLGLESGDDPDEDQTTQHAPDQTIYVATIKTRIAAAPTIEALRPIDTDLKNAFQTGNITEDTAVELRGLVRKRVTDLKNANSTYDPARQTP